MDKKIMVTRPSMPPMEEYFEEIKVLWETKWIANSGPKHQELEQKLKEYLLVSNIELFSNGHMALEMAIRGLGLKGEVITTPFTFASTVQALSMNGIKPVFVDVKKDDYTMDPTKIEEQITEKTTAILPVHVYGNICEMEMIEQIAKKNNLKVIYDAAHAFGIQRNGIGIGNYGDLTMFSFNATKVFNSVEGGALSFNNCELAPILNRIKQFGLNGQERVTEFGTNAKMTEIVAAMGLCNLRHIDDEIEKRRKAYMCYEQFLTNIKGVQLRKKHDGIKSNYAYFPIVVEPEIFGCTRDDILKKLADNNIFARKYFYPLCSEYECYENTYSVEDTPVAKKISHNVLTLPLYADLALEDVERICEIVISCRR